MLGSWANYQKELKMEHEIEIGNMEKNEKLFMEKMGFPRDSEGLDLTDNQLVNFLLLCHQEMIIPEENDEEETMDEGEGKVKVKVMKVSGSDMRNAMDEILGHGSPKIMEGQMAMQNIPKDMGALGNMEASGQQDGIQKIMDNFELDDYNTPYTFLDAYRRNGGNILEAIVPLQDAFQLDRDQAIPIIDQYVRQFSGS